MNLKTKAQTKEFLPSLFDTLKPLFSWVSEVGGVVLFLKELYETARFQKTPKKNILEQIVFVSFNSLSTTAMAGFFVGAIMAIQFAMQMNEFGAMGYLGGLATSATVREVGPLLIAFMLSGKVGAFTSAELGTMRVTEQIDAMRCLGASPISEIVLPRFYAIIISSFFLLMAGLLMSIFGGMLLGSLFAGVNPEEYIRHIPTILNPISILIGAFKCFLFALILASVCTYKGYRVTGGAKGVGKAVVGTAVTTMVGIVFFDWVSSFLFDSLLKAFGF